MSEIKTFLVKGIALFGESHYPVRQKFVKYVRALSENQAKEIIYSNFGSKNKIKRKNIKIEEIKEVDPNSINDKRIKDLMQLDHIVI
ncbi:50S ribosomal protein L18Ae [Sulfuracidifex tepidarius]|uniref:Large ribosomal subunit protein eL20 n=1 Tax=Sulfuracidifex tepidarius TaxID=1294262 RepID=A0A510DUR5_9CREN|nr:50S ribosomal protein L18Ae [Sulfuracidifex tepidarius]BBG23909.1 50S ribosomal protein L18Ae [Sulfuracidifex tepidarius]BBG26664.1 50S ribosomal protein L18Ae [Sulfuracidifex tepidarius]